METKSNIRRLLAGSSLVALLAASGPALGAGVTISSPTGPVTVSNTIDFIEVTLGGQVGGDLTIASSGIIDLAAQGTSFVGVDINQGDVLGGILNEGHIGVLATSTGLPIGIAVHGSGASIGGTGTSFGIQNDGKITVTGVNSAIGIAVTGTGVNFNAGHDITNNPSGGIGIKVKAHQEAASGQAVAAGIFIDRDFYNDVNNNGSIKVNATELSAVTSGVVSATSAAKASGSAHAIASGMGVGAQNSFAGLPSASEPNVFFGSLNNSGGVLNVQAQASSTHTAQATGSGGFFGNAVASALGIDTTAQAYGMFASAGTIAGNVTNTGNVGAIASANSVNNASAHGVNSTFTSVGDATALASGRVSATATGMRADAQSMLGSVVNSGNLGGQAIAKTTNVASADSTDTANAKASALGDAYALAYGMKGNVGSFIGSFQNNSAGLIDAFATATAKNTATIVDTSGSYAAATAHASSSVSATAFGMAGYFNSFNGIVANAGTINVSAVGAAQNTATVHVNGPATATADNGEYSATAYGDGLYITSNELIAAGSTGVSQGGTIGVLAQATAHHHAQATGTSLAQANAQGSVAAGGAGVFVGVSSFLGNFVNDGGITVTALGTVYSAATAKATGTSAGVADANGNNYAAARGYGINVNGQSFIGDFVNTVNGTLDINATATVFGSAKATGTSLNSASASLYDRAYANAGGINIQNYNSFTGSISNAAELNIGALASTINHATASASTGGASATAIDAYLASYARAYGITANIANMTGNFVNSGAVNASAAVREVDTADASGSAYANANAASNGLGKATGVSVGVGSTLSGSVSNLGTITVDAVVSTDTYAVADATSGSGQASVAGNVIAGALGFAVDGGTISGDIINGGDINAVAAAGAFNGSVSGEMTGLSLVGPGLGMLGYYATGLSFGVAGLAGAVATGTSFTAAHVRGDARAYSTGFRSSANSIGGSVFNSGDIHSGAIAVTTNEAYAHVDGYNTAYAAARGTGAYGNAHGVEIVGSTILGSVVNSSFVGAVALGASLNVAKAEGTSLSAGDATANAYGSAFGTAIGIGIDVNSLAGGFENYGGVSAIGIAAVYNDANALAGTSGTANARAQDVNFAGANATGISLAGNYLDSFRNNGDVSAWALSVSNNVAAAQATGTSYANVAHAQATGSAFADATGIYLSESTIAGAVTNSATVTAVAAAYVHDDAYAKGRSANAEAHNNKAHANAAGIYSSGTLFGGFDNTGDIYAFAYAGSLPAEVSGFANHAAATGTSYAHASAHGTASANALGIALNGGSYWGVSNNGSITVKASVSNDVTAVAVALAGNAEAFVSADSSAQATGISISGNVIGDFFNGIGAPISARATAAQHMTAHATGFSGAYNSSYSPEVQANAAGILAYGSISGNFINQAHITAVAKATSVAKMYASSTGVSNGGAATAVMSDGEGKATATAYAIYVSVNSLGGAFINSGGLTANATANWTGSLSAVAKGTGNAVATMYQDDDTVAAYAYGKGIYLNSNNNPISYFENSGSITVDSVANFSLDISATAASGSAQAISSESSYYYAEANATGIQLSNASIWGNFSNGTGGSMGIHASVVSAVSLQAKAGGSASAYIISPSATADAYGIRVNGNWIAGSFVNDGALTVKADVSSNVTAVASTTGVSASADATIYDNESNVSAQATGIQVSLNSIGGQFVNHATLEVNATAHAGAVVSALGNASNGENSAYAYASATADAVGISLHANSMVGNVINTGNITVTAHADTDSSAKATAGTSGDAHAYAANNEGYNSAQATATGIDAYVGTFGGSFTNSGDVTVNATATALGSASVSGPSAWATADSYARAYATGVALSGSQMTSVGGVILNSSLIDVAAKALATATMLLGAAGSGIGYASANARGRGMEVYSGGLLQNSVVNGDTITVSGSATATVTSDDGAIAWATAGAGGIGIQAQTFLGGFENTVGSRVSAVANASAEAYGQAYSRAYGYAGATGVSISGYQTLSGNVVNDGTIIADANAHARGTGTSHGHVGAYARGLYIYGNSFIGQIYNSGDISAAAVASGTGVMRSYASATGVYVDINNGTGNTYAFYNNGAIGAQATAGDTATAKGASFNGGSFAGAFENVGSFTTNEGTFVAFTAGFISADAKATDGGNAKAVAVDLNGTTFAGGLDNSGVISAHASAPGGTATATAILVEEGGYLGATTINNTGIIRATATGTSVTTNAINLDGASGGTLINQIGQTDESGNVLGGIYGDIQLNNGYGDLIDWTGGKIVGDIHGTTLDNFHVYAGLDNSFVFSGNINAGNSDSSGNYVADASRFGALTIGTGGSLAPAVSLEVAGNMYLGALNVQNNATLIVDPTAQIDASTVTIAGTGISTAAGTVQWNIQPVYPQNGSITGDVTIGTGAKSVANGLPGLFAATNDFWVIKDPNGVTGEFVTGTNPTTTDVTTVTPLGNFLNGLYTVTDGYVTSGAEQGYHIYVTRMSFADIPGLTEDGTNYGTYVDTILNNLQQNDPTGPLATLLGQILTGTPEEYAHALNEMSGHQNGDLLLAALGDPSKLLQIIFSELGGGDLGGSGGVASLDTFVQVADNGTISASTMNDAGPQYAALGTPTSVVERPASAWVRVFGNWSSLDRDASVGSNGYTANGGGVVVGGDYKFSDTFKAGLAAGYQKNKIDFRGAGNADTDSYSLSAYGRYTQGPLYVNGLLGASLQQYDMTRYYTPLATTYSAYRKPNGSTYSMGVEAGYAFDLGDNSKVTPFAGLMYSHTKIDGGTETGTGPGNLTLSEQSADSTASRLGVRWSKTFATDSGSSWTPIVELGWRHEFSDTNPSTTATLAGLPGSYTINGSDVPADAALVGLGLKLQLSDDIDGTVQYNGDFTSKSTNSTASVKIRMKF